ESTSFACLPFSASRRHVGQQGHLTRVLHRDGDVALVLHAVAGHPASADLAAVTDVLAQQRRVLVVDGNVAGLALLAERASLLLQHLFARGRLRHGLLPSYVWPARMRAE